MVRIGRGHRVSSETMRSTTRTIGRVAFGTAWLVMSACTPTQTHTSSPSEPSRVTVPEPDLQAMVVGTIDKDHLTQGGYPLSKLGDVFDAYKPDLVLVQIRPEAYKDNKLEDGPFEMAYVNTIAGSRGIDVEPIDYYKDADYGASPPAADPAEADQYKMEAGWLDSLSPYTFEQANTRETSLKILDATNASNRFLKGNPVWSRRVAWITHNAAEAVKKRKSKKVLAFVNILLRPYVEMRLLANGAVLREPVDVVNKAGESRESGSVPQPVVVEWQRGLDRLRDKLPRRGPERAPILAKIAILEAAVNKQGACCVSPNVLIPPPDPNAEERSDGKKKK